MTRSLLILALMVLDAVLALLGCFAVSPNVLRWLLARWCRRLQTYEPEYVPTGIPWRDLRVVTPKL